MKLLVICLFSLVALAATAQPGVKHSYDDAGNRVQRIIIPVLVRHLDTSNVTQQSGGTQIVAKEIETKPTEEAQTVTASSGNLLFKVFPNPTTGIVRFVVNDAFLAKNNKMFVVFDLSGKKVNDGVINSESTTMDFTTLKPGTYLLRIVADDFADQWEIVRQ